MNSSIPAPAARLLDFIGDIEAPRGYDTVYGNKQNTLSTPITKRTIGQVLELQRTQSWGSSAAGRYQFIRKTLAGLVRDRKIDGSALFSPHLQDNLAFVLLQRRGYAAFIGGRMTIEAFARSLAQEWASLPVLAPTQGQKRALTRGQSYYAGDGLNKSLVSAERFESQLRYVLALAHPEPAPDVPAAKPPIAVVDAVPAPAPALPPPAIARPWWLPEILWRRVAPTPPAPPRPTRGDPVVCRMQQQLADMGYGEVGEDDGLYGPKTRTAAKLFRDEQAPGLAIPFKPPLSPELIAAIAAGRPRQLPAERANATAQTLRDAGSSPVRAIDRFKPIAWLSGVLGFGGAAKESGLIDGLRHKADSALETAQAVQSLALALLGVLNWVVQHWYLFALFGGLWLALLIVNAIGNAVQLFRRNILGRAGA